MKIKIYGLHRSGTNFLRVILQENFDVEILHNEGGWKHGFYLCPGLIGEVHTIFITKNIFSWLVSMYNYCNSHSCQNNYKDFSEFLNNEFVLKAEKFEEAGFINCNYQFENPVHYYSEMHKHWLSIQMQEKKKTFCKYENLLTRPNTFANQLAKFFNFERKTKESYFIPKQHLKPLVKDYSLADIEKKELFDIGFYTKGLFMNFFTRQEIGLVIRTIDKVIYKQLGYSL